MRLRAPASAKGFGGAGRGSGLRASELLGLVLLLAAFVVGCSSKPDVPPPSLTAGDEVVHLGIPNAANAGAGVAASGDRIVVSWAATAADKTNIYASVSADGGRTFAAPVRVNDVDGDARMSGEQAPRVAVGRELVVGWISRLGGESSIRIARSTDGGRSFAPARAVHAPKLPRMAAVVITAPPVRISFMRSPRGTAPGSRHRSRPTCASAAKRRLSQRRTVPCIWPGGTCIQPTFATWRWRDRTMAARPFPHLFA